MSDNKKVAPEVTQADLDKKAADLKIREAAIEKKEAAIKTADNLKSQSVKNKADVEKRKQEEALKGPKVFIIKNLIPTNNPYSLAFPRLVKKGNTEVPYNDQITLEPGSNFIEGQISKEVQAKIQSHPNLEVIVDNVAQGDINEQAFINAVKDIANPNDLARIKASELTLGKRRNVLSAIFETEKKIEEEYNKAARK